MWLWLASGVVEVIALQAAIPAQAAAQVAELLFQMRHRQQGQTSACWILYCKSSGIMMQTNTLALLPSHLTAIERSGGTVTNVQMATCTAGLLPSTIEAAARAARNARARECASTILWQPRTL